MSSTDVAPINKKELSLSVADAVGQAVLRAPRWAFMASLPGTLFFRKKWRSASQSFGKDVYLDAAYEIGSAALAVGVYALTKEPDAAVAIYLGMKNTAAAMYDIGHRSETRYEEKVADDDLLEEIKRYKLGEVKP